MTSVVTSTVAATTEVTTIGTRSTNVLTFLMSLTSVSAYERLFRVAVSVKWSNSQTYLSIVASYKFFQS